MKEHAAVPAHEAEAQAGATHLVSRIRDFNNPPLIRQGRRDMARRYRHALAWRRRWGKIAWLVGALVFGLIVASLLCGADKLE